MELSKLFPQEDGLFWKRVFQDGREELTELRLRAGREAYAYVSGKEYYLREDGRLSPEKEKAKHFSKEELAHYLAHFCKYSPYAFEEELREGFLTLEGGHRLGVCGQVVMERGEVRTIKNIAFLNLRLCHQKKGIADPVLPWIYHGGEVKNTLILSPPGCGKTTLLRDLIRRISDGNSYGGGRTVGVVDERSELGGNYMGIPQNDLGSRTDVMEGCPKSLGLLLLLRSMSPAVIAVDELGGEEEWKELWKAGKSGVKILATVHAGNRQDLRGRIPEGLFEEAILLGKKNGIPGIMEHWSLEAERGGY